MRSSSGLIAIVVMIILFFWVQIVALCLATRARVGRITRDGISIRLTAIASSSSTEAAEATLTDSIRKSTVAWPATQIRQLVGLSIHRLYCSTKTKPKPEVAADVISNIGVGRNAAILSL